MAYKDQEKSREYGRKYSKIYHKKNKKLIREKYAIKRITLMNKLGGVECNYCGYPDYDVLTFDHINNDGNEKRKIRSKQTWVTFYLKNLKQAKKEIQVLCANCNSKKVKLYYEKYGRNNVFK